MTPLLSSAVMMMVPRAVDPDAIAVALSFDLVDKLPKGVFGFSFGFEDEDELACEADLRNSLPVSLYGPSSDS